MTDTTENDQEEWPDVHRPHDKLFKLTFREKERLADFMKHHLPTEVTGLMDLANLRIEPETFLDEKFGSARSHPGLAAALYSRRDSSAKVSRASLA